MRPADAFRVGLTMATILATAAVAVAAAPALAQVAVEGGGSTRGDPIPDFVFEEDGALGEDGPSVVIDGDIQTDCRSFASFFEEGELSADADTDLGQARRVLEQCEEAGLLDSGGGTPSASPSASASASGSASPSSEVSAVDGEGGELPETGGPALPALLVVAVGAVAASGLLARKVAG